MFRKVRKEKREECKKRKNVFQFVKCWMILKLLLRLGTSFMVRCTITRIAISTQVAMSQASQGMASRDMAIRMDTGTRVQKIAKKSAEKSDFFGPRFRQKWHFQPKRPSKSNFPKPTMSIFIDQNPICSNGDPFYEKSVPKNRIF